MRSSFKGRTRLDERISLSRPVIRGYQHRDLSRISLGSILHFMFGSQLVALVLSCQLFPNSRRAVDGRSTVTHHLYPYTYIECAARVLTDRSRHIHCSDQGVLIKRSFLLEGLILISFTQLETCPFFLHTTALMPTHPTWSTILANIKSEAHLTFCVHTHRLRLLTSIPSDFFEVLSDID